MIGNPAITAPGTTATVKICGSGSRSLANTAVARYRKSGNTTGDVTDIVMLVTVSFL